MPPWPCPGCYSAPAGLWRLRPYLSWPRAAPRGPGRRGDPVANRLREWLHLELGGIHVGTGARRIALEPRSEPEPQPEPSRPALGLPEAVWGGSPRRVP